MSDFLVFQIYGPMASWGDIAVGETRRSAAHPSKSAILGLLAAALGIDRDDEAVHKEMAEAYKIAVKVLSMGSLLIDYHTVQVPPQQRKASFRTRKDELSSGRLGTLLSSREYRCDAVYIAAVWADQQAVPFSFDQLAEALKEPKYSLYLGRKSCPPATPLNPRIIRNASLKEALDSKADIAAPPVGPTESSLYYWEDTPASGLEADQSFERWDLPGNRQRWQFRPRTENLFVGKKEE